MSFGTIVSPGQVEQAVLDLLSQPPSAGSTAARIVYYLADFERQTGLTPHTIPIPPGPSSFRGEIDFETLQAEWLPLIGVLVQPLEKPTRFGDGSYVQQYELEVAAIAGDDDEDVARRTADTYGACIAAALVQDGLTGIPASNVLLTESPKVEYLSPDTRQVSKSTATFVVTVQPVVTDNGAAPVWPSGGSDGSSSGDGDTWPSDPYTPPPAPSTIESVNIDIELMDTAADTADATFTGDDVITVSPT